MKRYPIGVTNECLITEAALDDLKDWVSRYVRSFSSSAPIIQQALALKEKHSLRVCSEILKIGKKIDMSRNNFRFPDPLRENSAL